MPAVPVGRFAPSPTGPLHFGSLVAALASYLDARSRGGRWLVRVEDIDPPREVPGAADIILRQLEAHGLHWDGAVLYQSRRTDAYREFLERLTALDLVYPCDCSRRLVRGMGGVYDGRCRRRERVGAEYSLRVKVPADTRVVFKDLIQGERMLRLDSDVGDFVVCRRDGHFAYQLAVAVDDAWQDITHVIRGSDLLDSTFRQRYLMQTLGLPPPEYGHIPVAVSSKGQKLSKQNRARPIATDSPARNLKRALAWLRHGPPPELADADYGELLQWGISNWQIHRIPGTLSLPAPAG